MIDDILEFNKKYDFTHRIRRGHQTSSGTSCPVG